jgi:orotate phosphoribosyltransferase
MNKSSRGWFQCFVNKGALWVHDGNNNRPHALLRSGNHSDGFFNSEWFMEDSQSLDYAANDLFDLVIGPGLSTRVVSRVVGPAMGAITLADNLARCFSIRWNNPTSPCLRAYTEKEGEGADLRMVFKRTAIREKEVVLLCEDVLTTGGSVELSSRAVTEAGGEVLPFVVVLVNRSSLSEVGGKKIISLVDRAMPMWKPDECPLCQQGSEAIRPEGTENWARLNATYC